MTMAKPTPGPYRHEEGHAYGSRIVRGRGGAHVAEVWNGGTKDPAGANAVAEANADLFCAAPDMLAQLRRYLPVLEAAERDPETWARLTAGTGVATLNAYRKSIEKAGDDA